MGAPNVADRETTRVEDVCDLVKSVADRSADPEAAYEAFLLGLEVARVHRAQGSISAPHKDTIRKAPPVMPADDDNFPTEWTLDP